MLIYVTKAEKSLVILTAQREEAEMFTEFYFNLEDIIPSGQSLPSPSHPHYHCQYCTIYSGRLKSWYFKNLHTKATVQTQQLGMV